MGEDLTAGSRATSGMALFKQPALPGPNTLARLQVVFILSLFVNIIALPLGPQVPALKLYAVRGMCAVVYRRESDCLWYRWLGLCCLLGPHFSVGKGCPKVALPLPPASTAPGKNFAVSILLASWFLCSGVVLPKPDSFAQLFGCSYLENRS